MQQFIKKIVNLMIKSLKTVDILHFFNQKKLFLFIENQNYNFYIKKRTVIFY